MEAIEKSFLKEGERLDELQRDGRRIIQHPGRFCFGMDAVLLSAFARVYPGEKVLDLCSGTGVIPILMESRYPGAHFTGRYGPAQRPDEWAGGADRHLAGGSAEL